MPHAPTLTRLLVPLAPLLLAACASAPSTPPAPVGQSLPERGADRVGTKESQYVDRFGCLPGPFDPSSLPKPLPSGQPGEFIAGYHNQVQPGTPCGTQVSHAYNGTFGFNLEDLRGATITQAVLLIDRRNTPVSNRVGGLAGGQCALPLLVASEPMDAGTSFGVVAGAPVQAPVQEVLQSDSTTTVSIPVTAEVQRWVLNDQPNYGFVLAPPAGALAKNDDSCTGYWSKPRLQLQVVPKG